MIGKLKTAFRRLFYYSSRHLLRRRRTYLTVFVSSIALLTVVMTALELYESRWLRNAEIRADGTHHIKIEAVLYDYAEEISAMKGVRSAWTVPWSSRLASSEDASVPARVSVVSPGTDAALNVRYLWGGPPSDGEIAVPESLFCSVDWLEAGTENELWFTASRMTYFPLTVSGIYASNDLGASYVFVTEKTAAAIDSETGAIMKYDTYIVGKYNSDRNAAMIADRVFRQFKIPDTDFQTRQPYHENKTKSGQMLEKYGQYINTRRLSDQVSYAATPITIRLLPVVAAAAMILAMFMTGWTAANAPEFGILGAIGAARRDLCAVSAGQIFLITLISSPPVVLFSALLSNVYISAYNRFTEDVGFVFVLPWLNLFKCAVRFCVLATLFTYLGIAALTREAPFVLISGSWRGRMPYVRKSSRALERVKDKVARLALLQTVRQIRGEVVHALICAALSFILGYYLLDGGSKLLDSMEKLREIRSAGAFDTVVSVRTVSGGFSEYDVRIPLSLRDEVLAADGVKECGTLTFVDAHTGSLREGLSELPHADFGHGWNYKPTAAADEMTLPMLIRNVREGDPSDLFSDPHAAIYVGYAFQNSLKEFSVGQEFSMVPYMERTKNGTRQAPEDLIRTFRIAAVCSSPEERKLTNGEGQYIILNPEGAKELGLVSEGECGKLCIVYEDGLGAEEGAALTETLKGMPSLLRYRVDNTDYLTASEKGVSRANTAMTLIFLVMVFLAFCVMTYLHSSMKAAKGRRDFAVERQLGATDGEIYKKMRVGTYPSAVIAFCLSLGVVLLMSVSIIFSGMADLNIQADMFPMTYTPEFYAKCKAEIFEEAAVGFLFFAASLPGQILSAGAAILGTIPSTRRLLKEPVTEGLRKDTD